MNGAEPSSARAIVRRESSISSPRNDADSAPVQAKAIVDQKTRSRKCVRGTSASAVQAVADPNRHQTAAPMPISRRVAAQRASAPALMSHFPRASPTTLMTVARRRPTVAAVMK